MRLTALSIVFEKLFGRPRRPAPRRLDTMTPAEVARVYGVTGEELLDRMDTFDFAPGAVADMMAAIDDTFEREPEVDS